MSDTYAYDLGTYSRRITTNSEHAQRWFDRGLMWSYSFNHLEAVRCFERAATADPGCAMAHWGIGYAIGPYYNKQWDRFDPVDLRNTLAKAYTATQMAQSCCATVTPVEKAMIGALGRRYPSETPGDNLSVWNDDYADAMRNVHAQFPEDSDVATLFIDALMNRTPWALWDLDTGEPCEGANTLEALAVAESAMACREAHKLKDHPGLLHVYIHLLEMSPTPERALLSADRLRQLAPDAGHLVHMPTHIDVQCGHYSEVVRSNDLAIEADMLYAHRENAWDSFQALSRAHNLHFKLYGAMLLGNYRAASEAANTLRTTFSESLMRTESPPMADWLEGYVAMWVHPLIRFGRWEELIATTLPEDQDLYCTTTAFIHYGKGLALAVLGRVAEAQAEALVFDAAVAKVPGTRRVFNNYCVDILSIANEMLRGEIEYRAKNFDDAFTHLRAAISKSDALPYDEPWGWMQPARHALGALLLEQGRLDEAEAVYRADLGLDPSVHRPCRHPDNVWALHGFHEVLRRLEKHAEADIIEPRLNVAVARADVPIQSSCLCRRATGEAAT